MGEWIRDAGQSVGLAFDQVEIVLEEAQKSAQVSHNHPEGIKGAQATALAVFLARIGKNKPEIRKQITRRFGYDLNRRVEDNPLFLQL